MTTSPAVEPIAPPDWESLDRVVRGSLFRPGSPGFRAGSTLFNRRWADRRPAAVLSVAGVEDIRTALRWAREHGVGIVARSGGHSFAGYSVNDGLVLDLSRMGFAHAEESTGLVTVGGGTRVGQVHDTVRPFEFAFPTGTSPLVGVAGLALGGGGSFSSRRYGLTLDAMVQTTLVTADGSVLTCSATENADLFWACRGAGGGNFGVHVSFVFQAQPVPDVTTFELTWDWADAVPALSAVQRVLLEAPDEFCVRMGVSTTGATAAAVERNRVVSAAGQFLGSPRELAPLLDSIRSAVTPIDSSVQHRTFWAANAQLRHATTGDAFAMHNNFASKPLPDNAFEEIRRWVERWPGSTNADGGGIGLFAWGGQTNRVAPDATAFVHRDTFLLASTDTSWTAADPPELVAANLHWLDGFHAGVRPWLSAGSYQNFPDPDLADWRDAYYGANYARLVEVKHRYDPDDVFRYDQSIGRDGGGNP